MKSPYAHLILLFLALAALTGTADAGPCDAYFRFDNSLTDDSGNGYNGEMIDANGAAAKANYTEGKYGQALQLDGTGAMRALIDLHWDICPQVTFSAWINVDRGASNSSPVMFSTGQGSGPGLYFSTTYLRLNGTESGIYQSNAVRPGSWMFIAGVYDYENDTYELYWGSRNPTQGKLSEHRTEAENAFWIATENDQWGTFAGGFAVDELRITGRALTAPELVTLQTSLSKTATGTSGDPVAGGSTQGTSTPTACDAQLNCPAGNYCAVDNICYPNSQLPKDYTAATTSSGDPGRSGLSNPNTTPGGLPVPNPSAGTVMAGLWTYSVQVLSGLPGSSQNFRHTTLKIFGRDNALSGTVSTTTGDISEQPLSNISKLGRTVNLSSPSYGSWSGQLSEDGRSMTLNSTDPAAQPRFFLKISDSAEPASPPVATTPPDPQPDPEPEPEPEDPVGPTNSHVRPGPSGSRQYSAISGVVADNRYTVELSNGFMTRIYWGEASNRPCEIQIDGWQPSTVSAGYEAVTQSRTFGSPCGASIGIATGLNNVVELDRTLAAIGRIQVCNNVNNNWRLKGLRIWGDAIQDDGTTTYIPSGDERELPNCEVWQSDVLCPSSTWATGLRVHTKDGSGDSKQITGLELICRSIVAPGTTN